MMLSKVTRGEKRIKSNRNVMTYSNPILKGYAQPQIPTCRPRYIIVRHSRKLLRRRLFGRWLFGRRRRICTVRPRIPALQSPDLLISARARPQFNKDIALHKLLTQPPVQQQSYSAGPAPVQQQSYSARPAPVQQQSYSAGPAPVQQQSYSAGPAPRSNKGLLTARKIETTQQLMSRFLSGGSSYAGGANSCYCPQKLVLPRLLLLTTPTATVPS